MSSSPLPPRVTDVIDGAAPVRGGAVPENTGGSGGMAGWRRFFARRTQMPRRLKFTREGKFFVGITLGVLILCDFDKAEFKLLVLDKLGAAAADAIHRSPRP